MDRGDGERRCLGGGASAANARARPGGGLEDHVGQCSLALACRGKERSDRPQVGPGRAARRSRCGPCGHSGDEAAGSCPPRDMPDYLGLADGQLGVELWIHKRHGITKDMVTAAASDPRRLLVHIQAESLKVWAHVAHAPCTGAEDQEQWWDDTEALLDRFCAGAVSPLVVMMDANGRLGMRRQRPWGRRTHRCRTPVGCDCTG